MWKNNPEISKKIIATLSLAIAVFAIFIWLGAGYIKYVTFDEPARLWPMLILYAVFPIAVGIVAKIRIKELILSSKDEGKIKIAPAKEDEQKQ